MNVQTQSNAISFCNPRNKQTQETIHLAEDYLEVVKFMDKWLRKSIRLCEFLLQSNGSESVEMIRDSLGTPGTTSKLFTLHSGIESVFSKDQARQQLYFSVRELGMAHNAWFSRNKKFAMKLSCDYRHEMILGGLVGRVKTSVPRLAFRPVFTPLTEHCVLEMDRDDLVRLISLRQRTEHYLQSLEEIRDVTDGFIVAQVLCESFRKIPCVVELFEDRSALNAFCADTGMALVENCVEAIAFIDKHETSAWCMSVQAATNTVENALDTTPEERFAQIEESAHNRNKRIPTA